MTETEHRKRNPKSVRMYDPAIDDYRDVTQSDFDLMFETLSALGQARIELNKAHARFVEPERVAA